MWFCKRTHCRFLVIDEKLMAWQNAVAIECRQALRTKSKIIPIQVMRLSIQTLRLGIAAIALSSSLVRLNAGTPPDRTFNSSNTSSPYGVINLDAFAASTDYEYCKWGVLMSEGELYNSDISRRFYGNTILTQNADLFLLNNIQSNTLLPYSEFGTKNVEWVLSGLTIPYSQLPDPNAVLMRQYHFPSSLQDVRGAGALIGPSTKKVIVLIHGWNPRSLSNCYDDPVEDKDFYLLSEALKRALAGTEWALVQYHWEKDADTGVVPTTSGAFGINGSEAAEAGRWHGYHLGELLDRLTDQQLTKAHFIVHSAGTWVGRGAVKYLLSARENSPLAPRIKTQLTLLDPFIPKELGIQDGPISNELSVDLINQITSGHGATADSVYRLENYFAKDSPFPAGTGPATQARFSWRTNGRDEGGFVVGDLGGNSGSGFLPGSGSVYDPYGSHSGPILFYADTIVASSPGAINPSQTWARLQNARTPTGNLYSQDRLDDYGWRRSIFFNEPLVTAHPSAPPAAVTVGASVPFSARAVLRGNRQSNPWTSPIEYLWERRLSGGQWEPLGDGNWKVDSTGIGSSYNQTNVQSWMNNMEVRAQVRTDAGYEVSNATILRVATSTTPNPPTTSPPNPPSNLNAIALSSNSVSLSWVDNSSDETSFRIQRRVKGEIGWKTLASVTAGKTGTPDSDSLTHSTSFEYQIAAVKGALVSDYSAIATAITMAPPASTYTLALASANPASGVSLSSFVGSAQFQTSSTPSSRSFASGTTVTVTCPQSLGGGIQLQKWILDGADYDFDDVATVTMNSAHALTAVYGSGPPPSRTFSSLSISGTSTVNESSSAAFTAMATFSDGSNQVATPSWSLSSGAPAGIAPSGVLNAGAVDADTLITVQAQATFGGVTRTATLAVTVRNASTSHSYTLSTNATNGQVIRTPDLPAYMSGTQVMLTAIPNTGYRFNVWTGASSGSSPSITVLMDRNKTVDANFSPGPPAGGVLVNISPPEVVAAGAQWKIDDDPWQNSGASYTPTSGNGDRFIKFKDIPGWITPANVYVLVSTGVSASKTASYKQVSGSIQVVLGPPDALTAGAQWRINGGAWQNSGATVNATAGNHSVEFKSVGAWTPPPVQTVSIAANQVLTVSGVYSPPLGLPVITSITPPNGPIEGGTAVNIEGSNFSAMSTVTFGGVPATSVSVQDSSHVVAVTPPRASYGTVAVQVKSSGQTAISANGFTYAVPRGQGIDLLGQLGGAVSALELSGNLAWIGEGSGLVAIDISNPNAPTALGRIGLPCMLNDIAISGTTAYVANDEAGIQVVNLSNTAAPAIRSFFDTPGNAKAITLLGGRAYVADGTGGLQILDLSNPSALTRTGAVDTPGDAAGVAVVTRSDGVYALIADGDNGMQVVNVSNPAQPTLQTTLSTGTAAVCIGVSGNYAYVGHISGASVKIVNITDPKSPSVVGTLDTSNWGVATGSLHVNGSLLWVLAPNSQGARVFSLAVPSAPTNYSLSPSSLLSLGAKIRGNGSLGLVADRTGLKLFDISTPSIPSNRGSYQSPVTNANRIDVNATHTFIADWSRGLRVIDVSTQGNPRLTGSYWITDGNALNVTLHGSYAYLSLGQNGLRAINITTPTSPIAEGLLLAANTSVSDFAFSGTTGVYGGFFQNGRMGVVDLTSPGAPSHRSSIDLPVTNDYQNIFGVTVRGTLAYVANADNGLRIVDISNPSSPSLRGSVSLGYARSVVLSADGSYAYVACSDGLRVVNVSNPSSPSVVGTFNASGICHDVQQSQGRVYLAASTQGILVVNVTNPAQPTLLASYDTAWGAFGVAVSGDIIHVADGEGGLNILGLKDTEPPDVIITNPVFNPTYTASAGTISLGGSASDNKGLARVVWSNNRGGGGDASGTTSWTISNVLLAPGNNVFTITAIDTSGNRGTDAITVTYLPPDTTAPLVKITSHVGGITNTIATSVDLTGVSTDNAAVVSVNWSSNRSSSGTASGTTAWAIGSIPLLPGSNIITVNASDAAGNTASDTITLVRTIPDDTPPVVIIDFPTLDAVFETTGSTLTLGGIASDASGIAGIAWSNDRGGKGAGKMGVRWTAGSVPLLPGLNVVTVTATDATGNTVSDSIAVTYKSASASGRPTVAITSPVANARMEAADVSVSGKSASSKGVSAVLYQLNDGPWLTAQGLTLWTASVQPPPGVNVIRAKSLDSTGAESPIMSRTFTRVLRSDLTLAIIGEGSLKYNGFTAPTGLEIARNYALTATPKAGHIFTGYSGSIVSEQPTITFTMQPGMSIVANFIATPFPAVAGTYLGLARTSPPTQASSGLLRIVPTAAGSFTGTLSVGGGSHGLNGKFSSTGQWVGQIARSKKTPLTLLLMLDVANGSDTLTGLVSDGVFTSSINTHRSTFKTGNVCPQQGRYTIAIDPEAGNTSAPTGYGYATFTVDASGNTVLAGKLGDGTALSSNAFVSKLGTRPLYLALYSSTGCVMGEATFATLAESDAAADLYWFKPTRPSDAYYKTGFETVPRLSAQAYVAPTVHHRALPGWDAVNGLGTAGVSGAGLLVSPLIQPITLSIDNKVTSDATVLKSLVVTIVPSTGAFSGSFLHPDTKKTTKHYGVLLQKTNEGVGIVLGATTTGSVLLAPQP